MTHRSAPQAPKTTAYLGDILSPDRNSFGAIRLAMAVAVLFSHSYLFRTGTSEAEPLYRWTGHSLGEHAVQVFFFLSGILIAQSFDRSRSVTAYATARVLRIFPGLVVCVLATALLLGPAVSRLDGVAYFTDGRLPAYIVKTISLVTGSAPLPGVFVDLPSANLVNMSLWTLKYELLCYIWVAALGFAGLFDARRRDIAAGLLAVFLAFIFIIEPKPAETFTVTDNVRYFALYFGMGTLAYLQRDRIPIHPLLALPLLGVFLNAIGTRFAEVACAVFLGYATLVIAARSLGPISRFTRDNDYSYGVYIYAAPIQQTLLQWRPDLDPMALSFWALAAVVPLAYLSWTYVEKPALAWRGRVAQWSMPAPLGMLTGLFALRNPGSAKARVELPGFDLAMLKPRRSQKRETGHRLLA